MSDIVCLGCDKDREKEKIPCPLSAVDKASFAFKTINERVPDIIGKTANFIESNQDHIGDYCQVNPDNLKTNELLEDTKLVVRDLLDLRGEILSNSPTRHLSLIPLDDKIEYFNDDIEVWNKILDSNRHQDGQLPRYYEASWLMVECYVYRRIKESLLRTKHLKMFDPFIEQKRAACVSSKNQMVIVANHLEQLGSLINKVAELDIEKEKEELNLFFKLALWANKSDLSLSGMSAANVKSSELLTNIKESLSSLNSNILCNDMSHVWSEFQDIKRKSTLTNNVFHLDLIADNSGYEIFVDLCLIHVLTLLLCPRTEEKSNIRFRLHLKRMPWFVSDTMRSDIDWLLEYMSGQGEILMEISNTWRSYFKSQLWQLNDDRFWTLPCDFSDMPCVAKDLYTMLQGSSLIIFKGDLNYRKLTGDRKWNILTPFKMTLRNFQPAPLVALRTCKADVVVGIESTEVIENITNGKLPTDWMISGNYGLIQYSKS